MPRSALPLLLLLLQAVPLARGGGEPLGLMELQAMSTSALTEHAREVGLSEEHISMLVDNWHYYWDGPDSAVANARRKAEQHGAAKREETLRGWDDRAVEVFENGKMPGGPCIEVVESGLAEVDGDSFQLGWLLKQTCVIYDGIGGAPLEGAPRPCAEGAVAFAEEGRPPSQALIAGILHRTEEQTRASMADPTEAEISQGREL